MMTVPMFSVITYMPNLQLMRWSIVAATHRSSSWSIESIENHGSTAGLRAISIKP